MDFTKLAALAEEYLSIIGQDHHKDRDCHWHIEVAIHAYGEQRIEYRVAHAGYIDDWDYPFPTPTFTSIPEAIAYAENRLARDITAARERIAADEAGGW